MSDVAASPRPLNPMSGEMAMSRLADRLAAMAPQEPLNLTSLQATSMPRPSPAVASALATSRAISARAAERARRSRSVTGLLVDGFIGMCSLLPYSLVSLALRVLLARAFFFDGQMRIDGTRYLLNYQDFSFAFSLPERVRGDTIAAFFSLPFSLPLVDVRAVAGHMLAYGEFVLPILLVLGLATRFAALSLILVTAMLALYVAPQAFWTAHIFWAAILLVLVSRGPGEFSLDALIRMIARR
jgi:putative oxidoreductase